MLQLYFQIKTILHANLSYGIFKDVDDIFLVVMWHNILHDLFTAMINCDESKDYFRSKDELVHLICAVGNELVNRQAHALSDVMITSAAPALAFWLYFCCWCHIPRPFDHYWKISNLGLPLSLSLGQYGKASVWYFPVTTSLSVIK